MLSSFYCSVWFIVVLFAFGLSPSYCVVWFVLDLLQRSVVSRLVTTFYLHGSDSNR